MYSYGSSARVGTGKRGHGGKEYRPPKKRRDPNATPPPLKQCSCLIELHLPEYQAKQREGRQHYSFGGRQSVERCITRIRSDYQVHLMVPGKNQEGPVNMVGKSYRETVPALAWLKNQLIVNDSFRGRIHPNVKDLQDQVIEGIIPLPGDDNRDKYLPFWLFQSTTWSVVVCDLFDNQARVSEDTTDNDAKDNSQQHSNEGLDRATALQTCLDNIVFRLGKDSIGKLDIFFDDNLERAFAVGGTEQCNVLFHEVTSAFQESSRGNGRSS